MAGFIDVLKLVEVPGFEKKVALGLIPGVEHINKFGETPDVDTTTTPQDIWSAAPDTYGEDSGVYTFSATADIDSVSSSNAGDTNTVMVVGLDSNWDEVSQSITLNGQTRVALTTSLLRVNRVYNNNGTAFAGDVYVYVNGALTGGVPDTKADIRAKVTAEAQQSEMGIYTVPAGKTALFTQAFVGMSRTGTAGNTAEFGYYIREESGVFRIQGRVACTSSGSTIFQYAYDTPNTLAEKTDIKFTCLNVSANNTGASCGFDILLFDNTIWGL